MLDFPEIFEYKFNSLPNTELVITFEVGERARALTGCALGNDNFLLKILN